MKPKTRYGAGEILGRNLENLTPPVRARLHDEPKPGCPPRQSCYAFDPNGVPKGKNALLCNKNGGVCSVRQYSADFGTHKNDSLIHGTVKASGPFITICPERFLEGGKVYSWIGKTLLDTDKPRIVRELPFLESSGRNKDAAIAEAESKEGKPVGRLDCVLVRADAPLTWCAVEMQAVYQSNSKTKNEWNYIAASEAVLPFPQSNPRPDYRSSGPKRLLPQLQVKVPTLSRWGVKTAVVVDEAFYGSLGRMQYANHSSNADIAWFVMKYEAQPDGNVSLVPGEVFYTTLGEAVEGLVSAQAIPKSAFEEAIKARLNANYPAQRA
jgi:Restriction endonuclease NotI